MPKAVEQIEKCPPPTECQEALSEKETHFGYMVSAEGIATYPDKIKR